MTMTLQDVRDIVEWEGFDYAFVDYSDFDGVEDEEFHRLRLAYLAAHDALASYLEANTSDEEINEDE